MAATWRTVRVFISSTFRDMHAERDHLVKVVFPDLRESLLKDRIHLVDIDLRWGVTTEQAENDQALDLCLQQIDECRPFFVGILGERYGWVPKDFPIEARKNFGWIQHHTGKSITELEMLYGVLDNPKMHSRAFFYFRDSAFCVDLTEDQAHIFLECPTEEELRDLSPAEAEARAKGRRQKLRDLKDRILSFSPDLFVYANYPCRWDNKARLRVTKNSGRLVDLELFGRSVHENLEKAIRTAPELTEHFASLRSGLSDPHGFAEEADYHERFMESRLRVYVGREQIQDDLMKFTESDSKVPCLVTGPSGSGKSAVLAKFATTYAERCPDALVIPHFIGASPKSTGLRAILRRFCLILKERFGFGDEVPQETNKLIAAFQESIYKVPAKAHVMFVIDALNQLDETDNAHTMHWLPTKLREQVKIVASCVDDPGRDEPVLQAMKYRSLNPLPLETLSDDERSGIVRQVPSLSAKTLDKTQVGLVLDNPATKNPLFLLVALEELRGFGSFEQLNERIQAFPRDGDSVTAIFTQVIERLEEEFNADLVRRILSVLASTRRGLSEQELQELVEKLNSAEDLFPVLRQLRPYLQYRGQLIDFFHHNLFRAVRAKYLGSEERQRGVHILLADYFETQADPNRDRSWIGELPRAFNELPFHLARAERTADLNRLLRDVLYLDARCVHDDVYELLHDYALRGPMAEGELQAYHEFILKHAQKLSKSESQLFALLCHEGFCSAREATECAIKRGRRRKPWISTSHIDLPRVPAVAPTDGTVNVITRYRFGPVSAAGVATERGIMFYMKQLGSIALVDIEEGRELPQVISVKPVVLLGLYPSPDGRYIAIAYEDGQCDTLALEYAQDGTVIQYDTATTVSYLTPALESPVMTWAENRLWFQGSSRTVNSWEHTRDGVVISEVVFPGDIEGEVSGIMHSVDPMALAVRRDHSTVVVAITAEAKPSLVNLPSVDVTATCILGESRFAVAGTDYTIRLFESGYVLREVRSIKVDELAACMACVEKQLIWVSEMGKVCALETSQRNSVQASGAIGRLFPEGEAFVASGLTADSKGRITAVTNIEVASFVLLAGKTDEFRPVRAVLRSSRGADYAIWQNKGGYWLTELGTNRTGFLIGEGEVTYRYLFGTDGTFHLLTAATSGQGVVFDIESFTRQRIAGIPTSVSCVEGDCQHGFWLADRNGSIYRVDAYGRCRIAASVGDAQTGRAQVRCWSELLLWYGVLTDDAVAGEGVVEAMFFFRVVGNRRSKLRLIGKRLFGKSEGVLQTVAYDNIREHLVVVWCGGKDSELGVSYGTPGDYIDCAEERKPMSGIHGNIVAARITEGDSGLYLLTNMGVLARVDADTFAFQSRLCPSTSFIGLADGRHRGKSVLVTDSDFRLFACVYRQGAGM